MTRTARQHEHPLIRFALIAATAAVGLAAPALVIAIVAAIFPPVLPGHTDQQSAQTAAHLAWFCLVPLATLALAIVTLVQARSRAPVLTPSFLPTSVRYHFTSKTNRFHLTAILGFVFLIFIAASAILTLVVCLGATPMRQSIEFAALGVTLSASALSVAGLSFVAFHRWWDRRNN